MIAEKECLDPQTLQMHQLPIYFAIGSDNGTIRWFRDGKKKYRFYFSNKLSTIISKTIHLNVSYEKLQTMLNLFWRFFTISRSLPL